MKKINKNIDFIVKKTKWSNADSGDTLEAQYGNPSLTDAYFKSKALGKESYGIGNNDTIIKAVISQSKKIASKYGNFTKLDIDGLGKAKAEVEAERIQSNKSFTSAINSLIDKYDDIVTSRDSASNIAKRNVRDVEGSYPNINHKYANLIKNVLDHWVTITSDSAIINYLDYLIAKSKLVDDEIEYAKEKNTYAVWKKLEGRGILDYQKKLIADNIKALTAKEPTTGTKINTTATADELINGAQPTSTKKWIIIGAGGLLVIGVLFFVFRKSSN